MAKQQLKISGTIIDSGVIYGIAQTHSLEPGTSLSITSKPSGDAGKVHVTVDVLRNVGSVCMKYPFEADEVNLKVEIIDLPEIPKRNPLHHEALTLDDLRVGLIIQRYHRNSHSYKAAVISSEPFQRGKKYPERHDSFDRAWMISVITVDYNDNPINEDWYLCDMGITPYVTPGGNFYRWNDENYTLAVK